MKNKSLLLMLAAGLSLIASVASPYAQDPVTYGAVIRLRHKLTGRYLTAANERYVHPGTSGQPAVYAVSDGNAPAAQWIVKGQHTSDRWNASIAPNADTNCNFMFGWPLRRGQFIRLENVATRRNLHSHPLPSPITRQQEVTNLGDNGVCNTDDNFKIEATTREAGEYVVFGLAFKLSHVNTNNALHSHGAWWQEGKQEVTCFGGRDDNDWWIPELVTQPDKNKDIEPAYNASRGAKVTYWTPILWDAEFGGLGQKMAKRRFWAHGGSPWDGGDRAVPPHDHMELLAGPWDDERSRWGSTIFVLHHADEKFRTGAIKFGDRVKIMATNGGRGADSKSGLLKPFRYIWVHDFSRHGSPYRDIVVTRPDHGQTQDDGAVFVIEPIITDQAGEISVNDIFRLRNVRTGTYIWLNIDSRHWHPWGGNSRWLEPLATLGDQDQWSRNHPQYGYLRNYVTEKYRFTLATNDSLTEGQAQTALASVNNELNAILGAEATKQKAIAEENARKQAEQQNEDLKKQLQAQKDEEARLKADAAKQLADAQKVAADQLAKAQQDAAAILAKVKADDAAAMAKAKAEADALLAAAKKVAADTQKALEDQLAKERAQAREMMQKAKDAIEDAKKEAEDLAKQKISEVEAKAQAEAQLAAAQAEELKRMINLPVGFVKIPGKVKSVSFGLQDREIQKTVDNKGTKEKMLTFDDFGVVVLEDGSIAQYLLTTDPANPWQHVPLVDDKGAELKVASAAVGLDGTTYVISQDGKSLYGISWPGDTPAAMPHASKGFEAAEAKKANREKHAKRLGARKKHKGKGKHTKGKKQGVAARGAEKPHAAKAKKHEAKAGTEGKAKQHEGGKKKQHEKKNVEKKGGEKKKNNKKHPATPSEAPIAEQAAPVPAAH